MDPEYQGCGRLKGTSEHAAREPEYVAAVAEMYRTADATPYVEFLLACRG